MKRSLIPTALAAVMLAPTLCLAQATAGARSGGNASAGGNIASSDANYSADENSNASIDKSANGSNTSSATKHHRKHAMKSGDNAMPDSSTTNTTAGASPSNQ